VLCPTPPSSIINKINILYPHWRDECKEAERICGGKHNREFLEETKQWADKCREVYSDPYDRRAKLVRFAFGPVLEQPALVDLETLTQKLREHEAIQRIEAELKAEAAKALADAKAGIATPGKFTKRKKPLKRDASVAAVEEMGL
jgi:hypothetical protein